MDKIKEYAVTNYPKTFKDVKDVIVEENDIVYFVSAHKDGSPIVINKKLLMDKKIIKNNWSLSLGFYPGVCVGMRTYNEENQTTHVLYMPFVDIALEIFNN